MDGSKLALSVAVMVQDKLLLDAVTQRDAQDASVQRLQSAMRDAVAEVARDFPMLRKATGTAAGGVIPYPDGVGGACVHGVMRGRRAVPFTFDSLGIHVRVDGQYTVLYSDDTYDAEIYADIDLPKYVGQSMLAMLVARNYCILCGRLDEAEIFDSRYEQHAQGIRLKRRAFLPPRTFI